jgi:glycosyltransferase involved in cell wall biosynthesis
MRVVHCITGLQGDGAQRMLLRLAEGLQGRGIESVVLSMSPREPLADIFEARGIRVFSLNVSPSVQGVLVVPQVRRLINDLAPDVLQGWMYHANLMITLMRPFLRRTIPVVWNIRRGTDDVHERKFLTRLVIRANAWFSSRADRIVYCTPESKVQHEALGFSRENGIVIGNGFNVDQFARSREARRRTRERYGVAESDILIGNVGRDDSAKGRPYLFGAFAELLKCVPNARLMLVGRGMSEANPDIRRLLVSCGIASRVVLVGEYSPVSDIYSAIDILCSSSVAEGFPNVIGEAMCCEVPCVASDVGNAGSLLDGVGVVVSPRSATQLAQALVSLCREGRESWRDRGVRSRSRISHMYSLECSVDRYASLYREVTSRGLVSGGLGGTLLEGSFDSGRALEAQER